MKAVVLAGGKGTRMGEVTRTTQKTMIDVRGKPVLQHQIEFLRSNGIEEIILSVGYLREQVQDFFLDGSGFGVKIDYIVEDEPAGTAGPLKIGAGMLTDTFVAMNGDTLVDVDVKKIAAFHKSKGAAATIMLIPSDETKSRGMVKMRDGMITEFVEKPDQDTKSLINGGFYVIEPSVIDSIPDGYSMLEKDVFPRLAADGKLAGWTGDASIMDMGTPERLEKTIKEWKPQV